MTINVTLSRPDLTPEQRRERSRRAREALDGMGWAFDELISQETQALLDSADDDMIGRDRHYRAARSAIDLKGHLAQIIDTQTAEDKTNDRRDRTAG